MFDTVVHGPQQGTHTHESKPPAGKETVAYSKMTIELSRIRTLDRTALLDLWREVHGTPPPKHLSVVFLSKALSYELQCKKLGGPSTRAWKALERTTSGKKNPSTIGSLKPGTRMVREWNGRTYTITVLEYGFELDGKHWASLSAIAKHITGAHWSGPRFFGLVK